MTYERKWIRNVIPGIAYYEVVGKFPIKFHEFVKQILSKERFREVAFELPIKQMYQRWGAYNDSIIEYERLGRLDDKGTKCIWHPTTRHSDEWYSQIRNEVVTSCTAYSCFDSICYYFTLAEKNTPSTKPEAQSKTQKVKVRCATSNKTSIQNHKEYKNPDDAEHPGEDLAAMLLEKNQYIALLHHELSGAQEQAARWKAESQRLTEENRRLRAQASEQERANQPTDFHAGTNNDSENIGKCQHPHKARAGDTAKTTSIPKSLVWVGCVGGHLLHICPRCRSLIARESLTRELRPGVYLCPYCKNEMTRK